MQDAGQMIIMGVFAEGYPDEFTRRFPDQP
jgi:hypothetical protein